MEANNVTSINNVDTVLTTTSNVIGTLTDIAETAPNTVYGYQPYTITTVNYNTNLTVRSVTNGFVVDFQYSTYVAKTQKELNKLITQLLTVPKKGKK